MKSLLCWALVAAVAGCAAPRLELLPHPTASPPPVARAGALQAGTGRADITPPPGVGLTGFGPEGKKARGYRHRLYARALVLEDADGERIAFVQADLPMVSLLLQRSVAHAVAQETGIGADRLVLGATHTHSGPGHFFEMRGYNVLASSVMGFDREVVAFLAGRIAAAVREAADDLRDARAAWGETAVWTATRNRSLAAFERNRAEWKRRFPEPSVDSTFAMLRVDLKDSTGRYRPAAALSVFAIHATGNPPANDLLDGDIHAIVERRLERHIDSLNGAARYFRPSAVHLLMNGAEGDVIPDLPMSAACQVPWLARVRRPAGPRTPPGPELWIPPLSGEETACLRDGRARVNDLADGLGDVAIRLFESLGARVGQSVSLRRAFGTFVLTGPGPGALCAPRSGTATVGGAENGPSRFAHWRLLGLIDMGFEEGGAAARKPKGCQGTKRRFLAGLQKPVMRALPLPEHAQLSVVRVGSVILGAIPFEATTVAGDVIRQAMDSTLRRRGSTGHRVLLVGLANGYNSYLTSPAEYDAQHYEGGSTLYGPKSTERIAELMAGLAAELPLGREPSPAADVPAVYGRPGPGARVMAPPTAGPAPERIVRRVSAAWEGDALVIRWNDLHPGRLIPADGPVLRIDQKTSSGWVPLAWDDERHLEVRAVGRAGAEGYRWEARWTPEDRPAGPVRVVLLPREGLPEAATLISS